MSDITTSVLWKKGYRINSKNEWYKPALLGLPNPEPKPHPVHQPQATDAGKEKSTGSRCRVLITSYRVKLLDVDNLVGGCKFIIDALRYCKVIPDDSPECIELAVRQQRVRHFIDEHTEVELTAALQNPKTY